MRTFWPALVAAEYALGVRGHGRVSFLGGPRRLFRRLDVSQAHGIQEWHHFAQPGAD
jgi:hypothetical protein